MTDYKPDQLGGFRVGDLCDCRELGRCEVLEVLPDGLLRLRTATRCPVLVKASACKKFISTTD